MMSSKNMLCFCAVMLCVAVLGAATPATMLAEGESRIGRIVRYNTSSSCVTNDVDYLVVECTRDLNTSTVFETQCFNLLNESQALNPASYIELYIGSNVSALSTLISTFQPLVGASGTPGVSTLWLKLNLDEATSDARLDDISEAIDGIRSLLTTVSANSEQDISIGIVADEASFASYFGEQDIYSAIGSIDVLWYPTNNNGDLVANQTFDDYTVFNGIPASAIKVLVTGSSSCPDETSSLDLLSQGTVNTMFLPYNLNLPSSGSAGVSGLAWATVALLVAVVALAA